MPDKDKESKTREFALRGARVHLEYLEEQRQQIFELFPELSVPGEAFFSKSPTTKIHVRDSANALSIAGSAPRARRSYTSAFKESVVSLVKAGEYNVHIARKVGISPSLVSQWAANAGVPISRMPITARATRGSVSTEQSLLPAPKELSLSDLLGRETLVALERHAGPNGLATALELANKENVDRKQMKWRLLVRMRAQHVRRVSRGQYQITKKGRLWLEALQQQLNPG